MVSVDGEEVTLLIHRTNKNSLNTCYEYDDLKARKVSTHLSDYAA
jgi:hypothetical protein